MTQTRQPSVLLATYNYSFKKMSEKCVRIKKDVGMIPCQKLLIQEGTARLT